MIIIRPDPDALREAIELLRRNESFQTRLVQNVLRTAQQFCADRVAAQMRKQLHLLQSEASTHP